MFVSNIPVFPTGVGPVTPALRDPPTPASVPVTFSTISLIDSSPLMVTVKISDPADGVFTAASLTASGFSGAGQPAGQFLFIGTADVATAAIRQLVFRPTENQVPERQHRDHELPHRRRRRRPPRRHGRHDLRGGDFDRRRQFAPLRGLVRTGPTPPTWATTGS